MRPPLDVAEIRAALAAAEPDEPWGEVSLVETVDSTNAEAARRDTLWSPIFAEHQSAGRGRLGRAWQDAPRAGLALSVQVPWVDPPGWLPLVAGLAVAEAITGCGVPAVVKWPNDVLLPGDDLRKVCGVLCEARPGLRSVVVGIGVNVVHARGELPLPTATSVRIGAEAAAATPPRREQVAARVLLALRAHHRSLGAGGAAAQEVRRRYLGACATVGARVAVHRPDGTVDEVDVRDIGADGSLLGQGERGSVTVTAGDVQHVRPAMTPRR